MIYDNLIDPLQQELFDKTGMSFENYPALKIVFESGLGKLPPHLTLMEDVFLQWSHNYSLFPEEYSGALALYLFNCMKDDKLPKGFEEQEFTEMPISELVGRITGNPNWARTAYEEAGQEMLENWRMAYLILDHYRGVADSGT